MNAAVLLLRAVNQGRSHIVAPREFLDRSTVITACKEMGGKETPQRVASGIFGDYRPPDHEVLFPRPHATFHQAQLSRSDSLSAITYLWL